MTPNKKKEGLARLFQIAGERKGLLILSGILSAISALCMLVPYWSIYEILNELLSKAGNLGSIDSDLLIYWGWIAFGGLIIGLILLYASLMASHVAAFRILYGLRVKLSEHIGKLSLGFLSDTSTGATLISRTSASSPEGQRSERMRTRCIESGGSSAPPRRLNR